MILKLGLELAVPILEAVCPNIAVILKLSACDFLEATKEVVLNSQLEPVEVAADGFSLQEKHRTKLEVPFQTKEELTALPNGIVGVVPTEKTFQLLAVGV